jgi:hypothetical protein
MGTFGEVESFYAEGKEGFDGIGWRLVGSPKRSRRPRGG